jgi:acyl-CoA thioester hydrolase
MIVLISQIQEVFPMNQAELNPELVDFYYFSPVKVRFAETDANQHMSHVSAVIYMEQARSEFLEGLELFHPTKIAQEGKTFVLAKQTIEYKQQTYYNDVLEVYCRVSRIGRSSLEMEYALYNRQRDVVTCTGSSTVVYFDHLEQKSTPLPSDLQELIVRLESEYKQRAATREWHTFTF